jgi:pyridoxal phosphate enzyme (YggS family)
VSIAEGLAEVRARIERAALASGRDPAGIRLVAVSKTKSPEAVREAFDAGQRAFGENYAQELAAKAEACADLKGIQWHFIGHLQTNKARVVARHAHWVHTVDSVPLARELGKRAAAAGEAAPPLPVLIEVNVAREPQKTGAAASEIEEVMRAVQAEKALALRGLMTVPPQGSPGLAKKCFETLVSLRNLHGGTVVLPELSMGMTSDLEVAVACGATIVRVGTAIFGQREQREQRERERQTGQR